MHDGLLNSYSKRAIDYFIEQSYRPLTLPPLLVRLVTLGEPL